MRPWLKLWRKSKKNKIFRFDRTAWHIFETLMIYCEEETGIWEGGRYQLAALSDEKPGTTYDALKRLKNAKMVTLSTNTNYTTIQIRNWLKHQFDDNTNEQHNAPTADQHQTNTLIKNIDIDKKVSNDTKRVDIDEAINEWEQTLGVKAPSKATMSRYPLKRLIDKHGLTQVLGAIKAVGVAQGERFAPAINNPKDLEDKWLQLKKFWFTKKEERGSSINLD